MPFRVIMMIDFWGIQDQTQSPQFLSKLIIGKFEVIQDFVVNSGLK